MGEFGGSPQAPSKALLDSPPAGTGGKIWAHVQDKEGRGLQWPLRGGDVQMAWCNPLKGARRLPDGTGSGQVTWRGPWVFLGEDMTSCALMDWGLKPWESAPWLGHLGSVELLGQEALRPRWIRDLELAISSLHSWFSSLDCCEDQMK